MRRIAIVNQKGGSGKTTAAVNLAAALADQGRRVALLDLDPQASATSWFRIPESERGLAEVFLEDRPLREVLDATDTPGIVVGPASAWLLGLDKALARVHDAEFVLRRHVDDLSEQDWDYVLMDCPPTLGILTVSALVAAREVLIPVEAHVLALRGLVQLLQTVDLVTNRLNSDLEVTGILACRVKRQTRHAREVIGELRSRFGNLVFETVIRESIRLAECPSFGLPITRYCPRCAGAEDFRALALEVVQQERSR